MMMMMIRSRGGAETRTGGRSWTVESPASRCSGESSHCEDVDDDFVDDDGDEDDDDDNEDDDDDDDDDVAG